MSIMESAFFAFQKPLSLKDLARLFQEGEVCTSEIRQALEMIQKKSLHPSCGVELKEVAGGYQFRTKEENKNHLRRLIRGRLFKLSAPALEVLSFVVYNQPCTKGDVDRVRGVESGHLLKTLMEKELLGFGDKSQGPGGAVTYKTTRRFLEVFGLKTLKDLPSLEDMKELLPPEMVEGDWGLKQVVEGTGATPSQVLQKRKTIEREFDLISDKIKTVGPLPQKIKTYEEGVK